MVTSDIEYAECDRCGGSVPREETEEYHGARFCQSCIVDEKLLSGEYGTMNVQCEECGAIVAEENATHEVTAGYDGPVELYFCPSCSA